MHKILYFCFALTALLLAGCEAKDEWKPGEPTPAGNAVVYFSSENPGVVGHLDGNTSFRLTLERTDTNGELAVPIVVTDSVGSMAVPASVTFADGEDEAVLTVTYTYQPGMYLSLSLGEGFGDPYLEQDGTVNFKCNIATLKPLCRVEYREDSKLGEVESYIYHFEGMNRFRFTNFMDSKVDVDFTVSTAHYGTKFDPENLRTLRGDFIPVSNKYEDEEGCWYLYDSNAQDYPIWKPTGWDKTVYYYYYYCYSEDYSASYSYIDFLKPSSDGKKRESYFWSSLFYYDEDCTEYLQNTVNYTMDFDIEP